MAQYLQRRPVKLAGTSCEIAAQWAEVNGRQIKKHVAGFLADVNRRKISRETPVAGKISASNR